MKLAKNYNKNVLVLVFYLICKVINTWQHAMCHLASFLIVVAVRKSSQDIRIRLKSQIKMFTFESFII